MAMNCEELHEIEGLQFIPVNAMKQPLVKDWQNSTQKYDLSNCIAVGLVCGKPSGNIEVIDIDVHGDVAQEYGVRSVPTLVMLDENTEVKRLIGSRTVNQLQEWAQ